MILVKDKHYKEVTVSKWSDLVKCEELHRSSFEEGKKKEWIFRGQDNSKCCLQTTLERDIGNIGIDTKKLRIEIRKKLLQKFAKPEKYCKKYDEEFDKEYKTKLRKLLIKGLNGQSICEIESGLLRKFKRHYHHYDLRVPKEDNVIEWLALMRHYGAPSRLLDWTYSFYVAVFFALEEAKDDCAVWALEKFSIINSLPDDIKKILDEDEDVIKCETWKNVFKREKPIPFVYPVNPFRLNERLVIQQGDFLCPSDISKPFEENLAAALPEGKGKSEHKLFKYIIKFDVNERQKGLLNLHRMNINKASLFPGLEGFSKSLKTLLVSPKNLIKPDLDCEEIKSS